MEAWRGAVGLSAPGGRGSGQPRSRLALHARALQRGSTGRVIVAAPASRAGTLRKDCPRAGILVVSTDIDTDIDTDTRSPR